MFRRSRRDAGLPLLQVNARPVGLSPAWDRLIVLANRAPYRHEHSGDGRVTLTRTASGLVTALEPLVVACSGTWVAHASGSADSFVADARGRIEVPRDQPRYRVRYVPLEPDQHRGFYYGFANEALWPLCHAVAVPPVFRSPDYRHYEAANARFAHAVADEATNSSPLVMVQDYHFALAPRRIRQLLPESGVVSFWHIPWPRVRRFRTCPWHRELLSGMLGSDIIGFQSAQHAANFVECVRTLPGAEVDTDQTITFCNHTTRVGVYPVGVDWDGEAMRMAPAPGICREQILRDFDLPEGIYLGIGIDRLDYTKGLYEKFLTIERTLEDYPLLRGRLTFIQVAEPSRECLPAYRCERARLRDVAARVNERFGTTSYTPIRLLETHYDAADVYRMYRAADLCYVGSLDDGMNLVAKEFVHSRNDERGVLILSEFAGAAEQLRTAVLVNPSAIDESAAALAGACGMSEVEQCARMQLMRAKVRAFDSNWWARRLLADAQAARTARAAGERPLSLSRARAARAQPVFAG